MGDPVLRTRDFRHQELDSDSVRNRESLVRYLSQSLTGDYRTVVGEDEIRTTTTAVKSYLIELHREADDPLHAWKRAGFLEITSLDDRTLIKAEDSKGAVYFIDARNRRFQIVHTIDRVDLTDQTIDRLTSGESGGFDHAWMPGQFLKSQNRGHLTGFSFRFVAAMPGVLSDDVDVNRETGEIRPSVRKRSGTSLKITEYSQAEEEFHELLASKVLVGRKSLDQIEFRVADPEEPGDYYTSSGVYSWGKVVTRGTWIGGHFSTMDAIAESYDQLIRRIEDQYAVGWVPHGRGLVHRGRPFLFRLPGEVAISDLARFVEKLFSATKPFRMIGVRDRVSNSRVDVAAVDLHSGDPVSFEITPYWLRVYLPIGSCGNIIPRLYTNLLGSVNSEISLDLDSGENPFESEELWPPRV